MSLIPAFQIGLWNAWILIALNSLTIMIPSLINKEGVARAMGRGENAPQSSRTQKIVLLITHALIMPATIFYSIFLPLKLETTWLYIGLPIWFLAMIISFMAGVSFATTPLEDPVTRGIYRISRHPIYFGGFLINLGVGIACASWFFIVCALLWIICMQIGVIDEERFLLKKYGDAYRKYINQTPRWIGMPKSGKKAWTTFHRRK